MKPCPSRRRSQWVSCLALLNVRSVPSLVMCSMIILALPQNCVWNLCVYPQLTFPEGFWQAGVHGRPRALHIRRLLVRHSRCEHWALFSPPLPRLTYPGRQPHGQNTILQARPSLTRPPPWAAPTGALAVSPMQVVLPKRYCLRTLPLVTVLLRVVGGREPLETVTAILPINAYRNLSLTWEASQV